MKKDFGEERCLICSADPHERKDCLWFEEIKSVWTLARSKCKWGGGDLLKHRGRLRPECLFRRPDTGNDGK